MVIDQYNQGGRIKEFTQRFKLTNGARHSATFLPLLAGRECQYSIE